MIWWWLACTDVTPNKSGDTAVNADSGALDDSAPDSTSHDSGANDSGHSQDSDPPDDSGTPATCPTPFVGPMGEDPAFWTEPGPLAALILPAELPTDDHWEIRLATSPDASNWTPDPRVLGIHLSSLNLIEIDGGYVINVGVDARLAEPYGIAPPVDSIVVLATRDFQSFASHNLGLLGSDTHLPVDASLWADAEGAVHAVYYNYPGEIDSGDPASWPGEHVISTARYDGGCFTEGPDIYGAEGLLDPMMCTQADGERWLFATGPDMRIVGARAGEGEEQFTTSFEWEEYTVPYCFPEGDALFLLGQTPNGDAGLYTAAVTSTDVFVELGPLYDEEPFENCTSPVMFKKDGIYHLLCAVWTFDEDGDDPPPPPG